MFFGKKKETYLFALPGNPASTLSCFYVYVVPLIKKLQGDDGKGLSRFQLPITHRFSTKEPRALFLKALKKMIPTLKMEDIVEGRSGVRAMALSYDGEVIDDFKMVKNKNNLHVLNTPSPAATACLAVGEQIMGKAKSHFNLKNLR